MTPIVHSVEISRSPEDVFARLSDVPRFSEWQEGVVRAQLEGDGPMVARLEVEDDTPRRWARADHDQRHDRVQSAPQFRVPRD